MEFITQLSNWVNYLSEFNIISMIFRLSLALVLGGLIGLDREKSTRSAGFRTYSLVCLGATLVMLIGNYIYIEFNGHADVARLGAQVINGIGFLGAGSIIVSGSQKIRGLTTAAALWTCACIGLAIGIGFYSGAFVACFLTLILLRTLRVVDKRYREKAHFVDLYIELYKSSDINKLVEFFTSNQIEIATLDSVNPKVPTSEIGVQIVLKVVKEQYSDLIIQTLTEYDFVNFAHKVYI